MLRGNPPIPFFLFLSISFPSLFPKKSENFRGGFKPPEPPLKHALEVEVERILFIYRKNSTKKDKENKTKQRKTMYSEQLYTITILALNKSIQAVQLIY